ncbi:MAG: TRAP transporter substrate-binding protein DctP [Lachnospiraceae bacterium]|nr:TRAP transporter substrate-binding protein DctP [Lachnospiraceae bacterium]
MKKLVAIGLSIAMAMTMMACGGTTASAPTAAPAESAAAPAAAETAPAGGDATYTLKFANVNNEQYPYHPASELFKEIVEEKTGGDIQVELYPGGTLGSETELVEQTQLGTLDMCVVATAPISNFIDSFKVFDLPFLFSDSAQEFEILDSEIGQGLMDQVKQIGVTGLGFWDNGIRSPSNSKIEINSMADLKGLKIRVMENDIHVAAYQAIGANPTTMAWSEVFTAVQQGTVDGFESSPIIYSTGKYYEIQKYYGVIEMLYSPALLMINSDKLASLPQEYQDIIKEAAREATLKERDLYQDAVVAALEDTQAHGMIITHPDKAEFVEAVQPVYDKFKDAIGAELIESIQNYSK